MKISRLMFIWLIILSFMILLSGCNSKTISTNDGLIVEGFILKVFEGKILVAENISENKYNEIKNQTLAELSHRDEYISLIYLSYDQTNNLNPGNHVKVWIEGGIDESYPAQAKANKIELK